MSANTVLVDGGDLASDNRVVQVLDDGFDTDVKRGANIEIPYADGELYVAKKRVARDFTVGVLVKSTSLIGVNDEVKTLTDMLPDLSSDDTTCELTLRKTFTDGVVDLVATAEFLGGMSPTLAAPGAVRLTLRFRLLGGGWTEAGS